MSPEHYLYNYLNIKDEPRAADVIIGFGHFDMNIPKRCCELYLRGLGKKIIFTGGVGAGSADFKNAEAIEFFQYARRFFPEIPPEDILIEDHSTNTGENIRFSIQLIKNHQPGFNFDRGISSAILVATPARQLRVYLTVLQHLPHIELINLPPDLSLDDNVTLFAEKGEDFTRQLTGEIYRLLEYPAKGLCAPVEVPHDITKHYKILIDR
ncbi:MAG: YdcF family protein [Bacteroidota bacterium]